MKYTCLSGRSLGEISPLIYGHFIEHFHRQIYGGVFDPGSPLSDEDGFRVDVLEAMRHIKVPILRWPGGCFVSSYHWKEGVGKNRIPSFDKAWRVEDPNTFGTDEYIKLCRKIGCEPYICTNAGTGTAEEMSDWVEYCNLEEEGRYAKWRIANGCKEPHNVRFWSIGNENYGSWEIGAKCAEEWGRFHQKGQVLYTDGVHKPDGMCDYAWDAVKVMAGPFSQGELIQPRGTWLKDDHVGVAACLDGIRPVIFLLEALQETSGNKSVQKERDLRHCLKSFFHVVRPAPRCSRSPVLICTAGSML